LHGQYDTGIARVFPGSMTLNAPTSMIILAGSGLGPFSTVAVLAMTLHQSPRVPRAKVLLTAAICRR